MVMVILVFLKNKCQALHANTWHPWKVNTGKNKEGTLVAAYRGLKRIFRSNNHTPINFWFCANEINRCMKGSKEKWVLDWLSLLTMWAVKVGTNLTHEEVFALKDVGFQL